MGSVKHTCSTRRVPGKIFDSYVDTLRCWVACGNERLAGQKQMHILDLSTGPVNLIDDESKCGRSWLVDNGT